MAVTYIRAPFHLDEPLPDLTWPLPASTVITAAFGPGGDRWERLAGLFDAVANAVAGADAVPVVVSGDCTTSLGTVAGLQRAGHEPAIVWFDAHGDVQTLETTHSGYLGGLPLRILVGYRPELIASALGLRPVAEDRVILVDARDLDPPEVEYLATAPIRHVGVAELSTVELPDRPIYLHVDLDVISPDDLPSVRFPAPGGEPIGPVFDAIRHVWNSGRVVGVGIACTWQPGHPDHSEKVRPYLEELFAEG